jgi:lambda repressor-like predicted transcriptional regulator
MDPNDPRHGTYSGGQAHIRGKTPMCDPCHTAHLRYRRRRRYDEALGRPRMTDASPVIRHLERLRSLGVTVRDIAQNSGVSDSTIDELLNRPRDTIRADNAAALLSTTPPPTPTGLVPSLGTIRRIRALSRLGWAMRDIERVSGVKLHTLREISSAEPPHVKVSNAEGVAAAYAELCMALPPSGRTASQVRSKAAAKGWPPPLAFDDIDDPTTHPSGVLTSKTRDHKPKDVVEEAVVLALVQGRPVESNRAEKVEAMRRWLAAGRSERSLCSLHGWHEGRYGRNAA